MKGLMKNNFYAALSSTKVFSVIMLLLGIFMAAMDNVIPSLLIGYILSVIIGFSANGIFALERENASRWRKYKMTAPVSRREIVGSYFINLLLCLLAGIAFAGIFTYLSVSIHGFPFDRGTDVLNLFAAGISISLFMGAVFFPLFYLGGDEIVEIAFLAISLFSAIGIVMGIVSLLNSIFGPKMTVEEIILGACILMVSSAAVFVAAYPLCVAIFKKKEY